MDTIIGDILAAVFQAVSGVDANAIVVLLLLSLSIEIILHPEIFYGRILPILGFLVGFRAVAIVAARVHLHPCQFWAMCLIGGLLGCILVLAARRFAVIVTTSMLTAAVVHSFGADPLTVLGASVVAAVLSLYFDRHTWVCMTVGLGAISLVVLVSGMLTVGGVNQVLCLAGVALRTGELSVFNCFQLVAVCIVFLFGLALHYRRIDVHEKWGAITSFLRRAPHLGSGR